MLLIGRGPNHRKDARLAETGGFGGGGIDVHQLGNSVVIEEIFVARIGQQVFVSGRRTGVAKALLHMRAFGQRGFSRRLAAARRNRLHDQCLVIAHPLHRAR